MNGKNTMNSLQRNKISETFEVMIDERNARDMKRSKDTSFKRF